MVLSEILDSVEKCVGYLFKSYQSKIYLQLLLASSVPSLQCFRPSHFICLGIQAVGGPKERTPCAACVSGS